MVATVIGCAKVDTEAADLTIGAVTDPDPDPWYQAQFIQC